MCARLVFNFRFQWDANNSVGAKQKGPLADCIVCLKRTDVAKRCGSVVVIVVVVSRRRRTTNRCSCSACLHGVYCSPTCQREDWAAHKNFCKQWQNMLEIEKRFRSNRCVPFGPTERVCFAAQSLARERTSGELLANIERVEAQRRAEELAKARAAPPQHAHAHPHAH